jgi:predicted DNA-binding transcriptional regulator YafY
MLTDDEAVAVVLGLVAGERAGLVTAQGAAAASAGAKLRRVLPVTLARHLDALVAAIDFTAPAREAAAPGVQVLLMLADAAARRHPVTIGYTSWRGSLSERVLEPYGLVFHAGRWYVTGPDSTSGEVRTFRLDRIASATPAAGTFEVPAGIDPTAHVLAGLAAVPYRHEVSVVLHAPLDEVRRRIPPAVGALTPVDDGVRLVMRAERLDGAAQALAGLGWTFVIEAPDELRDAVRSLAVRLLAGADRRPHEDRRA